MWWCPNHRRTTWAFLQRAGRAGIDQALSLELRGQDLVNRSTRSFSSSRATWWLTYSLPLSAWKPRMRNGNDSSRPSSRGRRKRSEMPCTAPTNSYWDRRPQAVGFDEVDEEQPLGAVAVALVDGVDADVAGQALRIGCLAQGDVDGGRPRPGPHGALGAVGRRAAQVVAVSVGERRQALEADVPEHLKLAAQDLARGQPRHLPVGLVPVPRLEDHRLVAFNEGPKLPDCAEPPRLDVHDHHRMVRRTPASPSLRVGIDPCVHHHLSLDSSFRCSV